MNNNWWLKLQERIWGLSPWDARQISLNLEHPESARVGYGSPNSFWLIRGIRRLVFWTYPRQTWQHDALSLTLFLLVILSPIR